MKTNFLKITGMFALMAILATSCKKDGADSATPSLKTTNSTAVIATNTVVTGSFTTPYSSPGGSTGDWGEVYFDLANNAATTGTAYQAIFNGSFDGNINANTGSSYKLAYQDITTKTLTTIAQSDLTVTGTVSTLGSNTSAIGWYAYNSTTHATGPVADRFAIVYKGTSIATATELYVLQVINVGYTADAAIAGNYFGQISFSYKKLI